MTSHATGGGGAFIQSAQTVDTAIRSSSSSSLVASGVSVSLTGVKPTSTVRIRCTGALSPNATEIIKFRAAIYRGTTSLVPGSCHGHFVGDLSTSAGSGNGALPFSLEAVDTAHGGGDLIWNLYWAPGVISQMGGTYNTNGTPWPCTLVAEEVAS